MKKAKLVAIIVLSILIFIIFLQNTESVETKILFMQVSMPRAILLILTFIVGLVAGTIITSLLLRKSEKKKTVKQDS
ncbi:MAG: lipopolysaccharide assembly protein LapA domain-containing protein [Sedimentisphaerales bacterium]|nr:lipopolysaccharide assembly protein LapA domain-containing protein [Sedimentisphaerales bacterium]